MGRQNLVRLLCLRRYKGKKVDVFVGRSDANVNADVEPALPMPEAGGFMSTLPATCMGTGGITDGLLLVSRGDLVQFHTAAAGQENVVQSFYMLSGLFNGNWKTTTIDAEADTTMMLAGCTDPHSTGYMYRAYFVRRAAQKCPSQKVWDLLTQGIRQKLFENFGQLVLETASNQGNLYDGILEPETPFSNMIQFDLGINSGSWVGGIAPNLHLGNLASASLIPRKVRFVHVAGNVFANTYVTAKMVEVLAKKNIVQAEKLDDKHKARIRACLDACTSSDGTFVSTGRENSLLAIMAAAVLSPEVQDRFDFEQLLKREGHFDLAAFKASLCMWIKTMLPPYQQAGAVNPAMSSRSMGKTITHLLQRLLAQNTVQGSLTDQECYLGTYESKADIKKRWQEAVAAANVQDAVVQENRGGYDVHQEVAKHITQVLEKNPRFHHRRNDEVKSGFQFDAWQRFRLNPPPPCLRVRSDLLYVCAAADVWVVPWGGGVAHLCKRPARCQQLCRGGPCTDGLCDHHGQEILLPDACQVCDEIRRSR